MQQDMTVWIASGVSGLFLGLVVSWSLAGPPALSESRGSARLLAFGGAVLLGVSLAAMRLAVADGDDALVFALGLCGTELSVVLVLEFIGRRLRDRYQVWAEDHRERGRLTALLDTSVSEVGRVKEKIAACDTAVEEFRAHLFDRESRARQIERLVAGAEKAVIDGYLAGIAENEGHLRGGGNGDRRRK